MSGGKDINLTKKKPNGRKTKYTITAARKATLKDNGYLELFNDKILTEYQCLFLINFERNPLNIGKACQATGISRQAFYSYLKNNEIFNNMYNELIENINENVQSKLLELIDLGDPNMVKFYLTTKAKHLGYGENIEVRLNKADDIEFIDVNEYNDDLDDSFILDNFQDN